MYHSLCFSDAEPWGKDCLIDDLCDVLGMSALMFAKLRNKLEASH